MFEFESYGDISIARGHNGNMGSNVNYYLYAVDGLLFDCGPQVMGEDVKKFVLSQGIKQVAVTHVHEDHSGMASWIAENLNVPVYVPPGDVETARSDGVYPKYRHMMWGDRPAFPALPMPELLKTEKYIFEPVDTPGHVPHHLVFLEKSRGWLFSGDLYVRTKYRYIDLEEDICRLMDSLEKVLKLDFKTVFCAHAGVLEDGKKAIEAKLDFLLHVREQVYTRRKSGMSDREINAELFPSDEFLSPLTDGQWTAYNLVRSI